MFGEILRFLVLWVAVFAIFTILSGLMFAFDREHDIVRRAARIGFTFATGITAIAIVIRLAVLAWQALGLR